MLPRDELRDELLSTLDCALAARPSDNGDPPVVGFDECVNNETLWKAVIALLHRGLLSGASPLWQKKRIRSDRSIVYVHGGVNRHFPATEFEGVEDAKATWPDEWVIAWLLPYLRFHDRLILVTEDAKIDPIHDPNGLHSLLLDVVAPVLAERHANRFSLTTLFKKSQTNWKEYSARMSHFAEQGRFDLGYSEMYL
jgi:hypothetical protein